MCRIPANSSRNRPANSPEHDRNRPSGNHETIIDRYVLGLFVRNYLISLMVLMGMYIALDMVFNFGNLTQALPWQENFTIWRMIYATSRISTFTRHFSFSCTFRA